jgi:ABC-type antimicrobial peptide transport system permease subunit
LIGQGFDVPLPEYDTVRRNIAGTVLSEVKLGIVQDVSVSIPVTYHIVQVPTIIATIEGENPDIASSLITQLDGQGWLDQETYFQSALNGGASSALFLTIAEELAAQNQAPAESIELVFLNGMMVSDRPLMSYLEEREERKLASKTLWIEKVGYADTFGLSFYFHPLKRTSDILGTHMLRSIRDAGVTIKMDKEPIASEPAMEKIADTYPPFFFMTDTHNDEMQGLLYTTADTTEIIDTGVLVSYGDMLLRYISRELYGHLPYTFMEPYYPYLTFAILLYLLLWGVGELGGSGMGPMARWIHHPVYKVARGLFGTLAPVLTVLLVINGVLNLPPNLNFENLGGELYTNFSLYEVLRGTTRNMMGFFSGLGIAGHQEFNLYLKRSMILIVIGIILSVCFGLIRGLFDSYRSKGRASGGALWSILFYSVPDVLISLLALLSVATLSRSDLVMQLMTTHTLRTYVMPVIALVFIPSIYISRMIYVTLQEEENKPYVIAYYYRGMSRKRIYARKLSFVAFLKILTSMKGIIMMLLSSLILVEYMFNYPGAMFHLIANRNNAFAVTYYALGIGVIFFMIHLIASAMHRMIAPRGDER